MDIVQRGGGVQPESNSFELVLFSPSLAFFWTIIGGERGSWVDHIPKVLTHFLPKYLAYAKVNSQLSKLGRYKSYLTDVQNEGGGSRPHLDNVKKKDTFLWLPSAFHTSCSPMWISSRLIQFCLREAFQKNKGSFFWTLSKSAIDLAPPPSFWTSLR